VTRRTAVVNKIRSLLLEGGLTLPKGRSHVGGQLFEKLYSSAGTRNGY
jgi:hypothetical protein